MFLNERHVFGSESGVSFSGTRTEYVRGLSLVSYRQAQLVVSPSLSWLALAPFVGCFRSERLVSSLEHHKLSPFGLHKAFPSSYVSTLFLYIGRLPFVPRLGHPAGASQSKVLSPPLVNLSWSLVYSWHGGNDLTLSLLLKEVGTGHPKMCYTGI